MIKRFVSLLTMVLLAFSGYAQNSISDINRIKRDKNYLYGEATLDTREAAIKLAYELLEVEIKNWAATKNAQINSVYASKVYEFADSIILQRHNMVRAFVFVKTSNLKAIKGKSMTVDVKPDEVLTKAIPEPSTVEGNTISVKEEPVGKEETPTKGKEAVPTNVDTPTQIDLVKEEPAPANLQPVQPEAIQRLMAVTSFHDLEDVIKPLKAEGKITGYGKYTTMSDPASCYLIIYDKEANIKAFLGKGAVTRPNLQTGLSDSEKNYHGCGAIWLKIKE